VPFFATGKILILQSLKLGTDQESGSISFASVDLPSGAAIVVAAVVVVIIIVVLLLPSHKALRFSRNSA